MKKNQTFLHIAIAISATAVTLLFLELAIRIYYRGNPVLASHDLVAGDFKSLYDYDSKLGWSVKSNTASMKWGHRIQTLKDGIRSNGKSLRKSGEAFTILAVGDSFTFGDEVADHETWPALLEQKLNQKFPDRLIRVLNAGVSSYGLDQTMLRAEHLLPKYHPDVVIISFIIDDIHRTKEYIRHGVAKPYFELLPSGALHLKNVPVPLFPTQKNFFRKYLSRCSYLAAFIESRIAPVAWHQSREFSIFELPSTDAEQMALGHALLEYFLVSTRQQGCKIIFVIQEDGAAEDYPIFHQYFNDYFKKVTDQDSNVQFVDVAGLLKTERIKKNPRIPFFYNPYGYHMSQEGNDFVASAIAGKAQFRFFLKAK